MTVRSKNLWWAIGWANFISGCFNLFHVTLGDVEVAALIFLGLNTFFVMFSLTTLKSLYAVVSPEKSAPPKSEVQRFNSYQPRLFKVPAPSRFESNMAIFQKTQIAASVFVAGLTRKGESQ